MKLNARIVSVLTVLALVTLCASAYTFVRIKSPASSAAVLGAATSTQTDTNNFRKTLVRWQTVFLTRDASTAYGQFIDEGNTMPSEQSHMVAHVVGGILYDINGLEGLSSCTDDFNYGCYHGFASRVIEEKGTAGISELTDACRQMRSLDCEHGIGHGLMVYFGDDRLNEALSACSVFGHRTGGCSAGVFMEHFMNSMRQRDDRGALAFDERAPDAPCTAVSDADDRVTCYYWLPVLWRTKVINTESAPAQFAYVGTLCGRVTDARMKAACFSGTGALTAPVVQFDEDESRTLCAAVPLEGQPLCEKTALDYIKRRIHPNL